MKSTKFYDIYTITHIVLIAVIYYIASKLVMNNFVENGSMIPIFTPLAIGKLIVYLLAFVYWLFILILSIKLHKEELTKIIDVIIIAIIPPLAPIFYLVNLRKSLKKYTGQGSTMIGNVPGTP